MDDFVDHFFRQKSVEVTAVLAKRFGAMHLDTIEQGIQEAFLKALQIWPLKGVPEKPFAWILVVARNYTIDELRREKVFLEKAESYYDKQTVVMEENLDAFQDEYIRLLYLCCHPSLKEGEKLAVTLKYACGFGVQQISQALFAKAEAIRKQIYRAKKKMQQQRIDFFIDFTEPETEERSDSVLRSLYLLYNEGYKASEGEGLLRYELCSEAERVLRILARSVIPHKEKIYALMALVLLQSARLPARIAEDGSLIVLKYQERSKWDFKKIQEGMHYLELSMQAKQQSVYHLQAAIAACHSIAAKYTDTNWQNILKLYDSLLQLDNSPLVHLNRSIAYAEIFGAEAALGLVDKIALEPQMQQYHLLPAWRGELFRRLGENGKAIEQYQQALSLAQTIPEQQFLRNCLRKLA